LRYAAWHPDRTARRTAWGDRGARFNQPGGADASGERSSREESIADEERMKFSRREILARAFAGPILSGSALLAAACGGGGGGGGGQAVPLSTRYPIDGVVDFTGLTKTTVALDYGSGTKSTTLDYAFANDDRDLYLAVQWTDDSYNHGYDFTGPTDFDGVLLLIDDDGNGSFDNGEDDRYVITATAAGSQYLDQHKSPNPSGADVCGDGFGRLTYDAANLRYQAEMRFPLAADAQGEDATIGAATPFNLLLFDHATSSSSDVAYRFPSDTDSTAWEAIPFVAAVPIARPAIPSDLTGLIAFTSLQDEPHGEIYTLDPATGVVTRVTNNTVYEDNVSLSHDRQWIAFHGAPTSADYTSYEIWKIGVDGNNLTQLTNNAILDGHPGWSPDDTKICYASFRDATASVVVMDSDGNEIADLTNTPDDDNDPDFLPDGRIVFKTNRFHPSPQVKIATMAVDGSDVQEVTFDVFSPSTSDHDPVGGDPTFTMFERFTKGTEYSTDIEALFSPWNIIEARLDGTGERVVVGDGFVNWLPVYDPTGKYIAHLKSTGYTDIHLLTRAGFDYGRLIPNHTQIRYLDWK
jgi:hypothetical protein